MVALPIYFLGLSGREPALVGRAPLQPVLADPPDKFPRHKATLIGLAICALCGCSVMPNNVASPSIKPATAVERNAGLKAQYVVNGKTVIYDTSFDESVAIMPVETSLNGVQSQVMALKGAYSSRRKYLLTELDLISNTQFAGVLISAIGVATKSNAVRNTGAGAAGLSNLWGSHYNLAVQSANYALAADAMNCISTELSSVAPSFWTLAYTPEGVFIQPKSDFVLPGGSQADTSAAYDALAGMYASLHSSIGRVDEKLRSLQAAVTISTVSLSDIQDAAANKTAAKKGADSTETKAMQDAAAQKAQTAKDNAAAASQNAADAAKAVSDTQGLMNTAALRLAAEEAKVVQAHDAYVQAKADVDVIEDKQKSLPPGPEADKARVERDQKIAVQREANSKFIHALSKRNAFLAAKQQADQAASALELKLAVAKANEQAAQKEAESTAKFAELVELGVLAKAVQVPASAAACVVAMGK